MAWQERQDHRPAYAYLKKLLQFLQWQKRQRGATAERWVLKTPNHLPTMGALFENVGQRTPRVRFGKVHVYNNLYDVKKVPSYVYSWGVGIESQIYAESNLFQTDQEIAPADLIARFNGTAIHESGTNVGGPADKDLVDVLAAYNAANDPHLSGDVGWAATLFTTIDPTRRVLPAVRSRAGPMEW